MTELLPWHRIPWQRLMRSRQQGRLPHALLCSGQLGLGKNVFAECLSRALLCDQPTMDGAFCGHCRGCRLWQANTHPDIIRISSPDDGKFIKVDQIRALSAFLERTSQFGGPKIAIVKAAERMTLHAANSLLKTLEEPPAGSLLLLLTTQPFQLPATIRSRCQILSFRSPNSAESRAWLEEQIGEEKDVDPGLLLSLAGGAPLVAKSYAQQDRLQRRKVLFQSFRQVTNGRMDPMQAADSWMQEDVMDNLNWLIGWHMDMIRLKMADKPLRFLNPDLRDSLHSMAAEVSPRTLFRRLDAAIRLRVLGATSQVNLQLMLEAFLADWSGVE